MCLPFQINKLWAYDGLLYSGSLLGNPLSYRLLLNILAHIQAFQKKNEKIMKFKVHHKLVDIFFYFNNLHRVLQIITHPTHTPSCSHSWVCVNLTWQCPRSTAVHHAAAAAGNIHKVHPNWKTVASFHHVTVEKEGYNRANLLAGNIMTSSPWWTHDCRCYGGGQWWAYKWG